MEAIAKQYLGTGYDVCGEYANGVSIKKRIFDLSVVHQDNIRKIPNTNAQYFSAKGDSYKEYQQSLSEKVGLSGSYDLFSGSVSSSFSSSELSIVESGFVSIKLFMRYETWKLQTHSEEHMYKTAVDEFNKKDGKWLIEQYGAAVVMGMDIGGQWSDNLSVSKLFDKSTSDVAISMEAAYGSFVSGSTSTEISNYVETEQSIASRRVNVVGGDPRYAPGKLEEWQASVAANPAFMNFTSDGLVWIWDIFPNHAAKLKKGFEEYMEEKKLNIDQRYLVECHNIEGFKYSSDAGSGAKQDLSLYKPAVEGTEFKYFGVNGNSNQVMIVKELSSKYGAVRAPTGWHQVWNDRGSGKHYDYNCWMPVGPPGYVALGVYCRFRVDHQNPPSADEAKGMVVVHKSLVRDTEYTRSSIWSDHGTGADYDLTLGRLPHHALWPSRETDPEAGILPSHYTIKGQYIHQ